MRAITSLIIVATSFVSITTAAVAEQIDLWGTKFTV
jgi:hypothetical protein